MFFQAQAHGEWSRSPSDKDFSNIEGLGAEIILSKILLKEVFFVKYVYPAIFRPEADGGFCIFFPDIARGATQGDNMIDGLGYACCGGYR